MNSNETRTLWISVGAALFAIMLLYSWSNEKAASMAKKYGSTKRVVVASQDIAEMETIDESKLEIIDLPVDFIQPDAVPEAEGAVGQVGGGSDQKARTDSADETFAPWSRHRPFDGSLSREARRDSPD